MGQRLGFTQESLLRPLPGGPRAPPLGSSRSTIVGCARDPLDPRGELASGRAPADEGDAAISVASPDENPTRDANARPCWRAATISLSTLIGTTVFSAKAWAPPSIAANGSLRSGLFSGFSVQVRDTLLQVERRRHSFERQPELDHRKRDLRLNPDDHGLGPAQAAHVGEVAQRADRIGVDHV